MSGRRRGRRAESTDDWEQLKLLAACPEQARYELIRPIVLFEHSPARRARETGEASERTLYRRAARFEAEGMESLFDAPTTKHRKLPPSLRRLIVDLKAEHPALSLGEIANVCYVRSGRRPSKSTVKRVLGEEPTPLIAVCNDIDPLLFRSLDVVSRVTPRLPAFRPGRRGSLEWVNCNDYRYNDPATAP